MTFRVKLNDRDYSAALFNIQPHEDEGYHTISAALVLKETKKESIQEDSIEADRFHIYFKDVKRSYQSTGEKVPDALYTLFANTMAKKGQGKRVIIKEILKENGGKLAKKIIAVGVNL